MLDGFEVAVQHLFDNNFGVLANMTFIGGDTDAIEQSWANSLHFLDLVMQQRLVFYEDDKMSARLSQSKRNIRRNGSITFTYC